MTSDDSRGGVDEARRWPKRRITPISLLLLTCLATRSIGAYGAPSGPVPDEQDVRQAVAVFYETALRGMQMADSGCSIMKEPGCTV